MNFVSLFSGGGGADIGAILAGHTPIAAYEFDPEIAAVYRRNLGDHVHVEDLSTFTPPAIDLSDGILWASPPCQAYSVARNPNLPERGDKDVGLCIMRWVEVTEPKYVFIENVRGYSAAYDKLLAQMRKDNKRLAARSMMLWDRTDYEEPVSTFEHIVLFLKSRGYSVEWGVVNAADHAVPQSRMRLILRAALGSLPPLPPPTRHIGWYEAIEDLIPSLPRTEFAEWQLRKLPDDFDSNLFVRTDNSGQEWGKGYREEGEPMYSLSSASRGKAFIISGENASTKGIITDDQPFQTVTTGSTSKHPHRAFIVDGQPNDRGRSVTVRQEDSPMFTLTASMYKRPTRAWLERGIVVKMTPRCLARFQSFPDTYELPAKDATACKIIGNAVPPNLAFRIIQATTGGNHG